MQIFSLIDIIVSLVVSVVITIFFTLMLWNGVMPSVFGVKKMDLGQTFALLILAGIFFGGSCNAINLMIELFN